MKLNTYLLLGFLCMVGISYYLLIRKTNIPLNKSTFVVGMAAGYAPWVSVNEQGEYEGFDIDVMKALSKQMNKELVLKDLGSMPSLFMALEQNKIDVIIWGMSITQDRLNRMNMVRYQGETITSFPLIFWKKIPDGVTSIEDMSGKNVCVEPSSSQDIVLSAYTSINIIPTEKVDDALLHIQYGKADAALVEPAIAKKFKKKCPEIQILDVPLAPANQVKGVGICIKKDNIVLTDQVTQPTNVLLENGSIQKFESKWGIS